jgi:plasmid maintenance system antidote protein VapI
MDSVTAPSRPLTPADFRAEIARRQLRIYDLAPHVGMHPAKLGAVLNERAPLTPAIAARLTEAITTTLRGMERRSAR